ncbi:MAG: hypothetical protein IPN79_01095 [Saprospiraceae bacterium]|nr:hypothetical protein [Saprospiraceae bacterium]
MNTYFQPPKLRIYLFIFFLGFTQWAYGQFGAGFTMNTDIYQRYTNPMDNQNEGRSSGSTLLNFSIGPKLWFGKNNFSFSVESQIGMGFTGYDTDGYKGMGMINVPIIGSFNFNGASTLSKDNKPGFSIGGGIQYNKTEAYGLRDKYVNQGLKRDFFPTYIIQAGGGFGFGPSGVAFLGFVRYGFHPDTEASSLNIGIQYDINYLAFRKNFKNPNSAL